MSDPAFLGRHTRRVPLFCGHASALDSRERGVTTVVAVAVPWSRSGQRSTSSSRPASAPVGNFSRSPASRARPRPARAPGPGCPGCGRSAWPTTPCRHTSEPVQQLCRSGPVQRPLDPDLEGVPERGEDGRQCLAGPQRRRAQHHRRPDVRGGQVGRQELGGSPAPRRQGPVGIGKAWLVPAGLGMAEQPEALHVGPVS